MINGYTYLYDQDSTYRDGLSLGGGAIYCSMCKIISLKSVIFSNNYAKNGGAMIIAFDSATQPTESSLTIDSCTFKNSRATLHGGAVYVIEKLDSTIDPHLIKVVLDLKTNTFTGSEANYQDIISSTTKGSGGVFYLFLESLDLLVNGGNYINSKAYYGAIFYIETFAN